MRRREFIALLGSAAAYPATGWGQEAKQMPRIRVSGVWHRCRACQPRGRA